MKRIYLMTALAAVAISSSAFAGTKLTCKSNNYMVSIIQSDKAVPSANYGINGWENDAADVEIGKSYFSERAIAAQLTVDGQPNKFELSVVKTGKNRYSGKIFYGKSAQDAKCKSTYAVTADERDDDSDQSL